MQSFVILMSGDLRDQTHQLERRLLPLSTLSLAKSTSVLAKSLVLSLDPGSFLKLWTKFPERIQGHLLEKLGEFLLGDLYRAHAATATMSTRF